MGKDVMDTLRMVKQHVELCAESPEVLSLLDEAHDRIAGLIAADVEYDEAHANWVRWGRPVSGKAVAAYKAAEKRRAAKLAACGGM